MPTISAGFQEGQGDGRAADGTVVQGSARMEVVAETNDPVRLSFLLVLLRDAGLQPQTYDSNMAAALGGAAAAVRQRVAVPAEQAMQARRVLREAGYDD